MNFIKKRLQHRYFPVKIMKFLRTPVLKKHLPTTVSVLHSYHLLLFICSTFYSISSSSSSQLLLLITLMFDFNSNSKGFKEFKSSISFSLKPLISVVFSHVFSVFLNFVLFFLVTANKKESFKLRIN